MREMWWLSKDETVRHIGTFDCRPKKKFQSFYSSVTSLKFAFIGTFDCRPKKKFQSFYSSLTLLKFAIIGTFDCRPKKKVPILLFSCNFSQICFWSYCVSYPQTLIFVSDISDSYQYKKLIRIVFFSSTCFLMRACSGIIMLQPKVKDEFSPTIAIVRPLTLWGAWNLVVGLVKLTRCNFPASLTSARFLWWSAALLMPWSL